MNETAYKGFRQDEMEYQYNPRVSVPEYPELAKVRSAQARKVRESAKSWLNVAYGSSPRELVDRVHKAMNVKWGQCLGINREYYSVIQVADRVC